LCFYNFLRYVSVHILLKCPGSAHSTRFIDNHNTDKMYYLVGITYSLLLLQLENSLFLKTARLQA